MKLSFQRKRAATLAGTALITTLGAACAAADSHGFAAQDLESGFLLAAKADTEGKCGEGNCGEGKSGSASSDTKGSAEGKCGEGKCGAASEATKDSVEGKCGEGKCGGAA